jgi:hypothetical protein
MSEPATQHFTRLYERKLAALEALKKSLLHQKPSLENYERAISNPNGIAALSPGLCRRRYPGTHGPLFFPTPTGLHHLLPRWGNPAGATFSFSHVRHGWLCCQCHNRINPT